MSEMKTRHQSVADFFVTLQKEWLIAEFRRKIYVLPKDKKYYDRVMAGKAEKINDIANRNCLSSIFNDEEKRELYYKELFDIFNRPTWFMSPSDIENYYAVGSEFSYQGEIFVLEQVNEDNSVTLYSNEKELFKTVGKEEINRIL